MILITSLQDKKIFYFLNWTESTLTKYFNKVQYMFELLRYGKEQEIKSAPTYKSDDNSNIDDKEQVRDLGIMMSNTATVTLHIRNIVEKSRDKMGWVLRVFQSRQRSLMLTLLKSLVIPLQEYCCRSGTHMESKRHIQAVDAMQRTFTYNITEVQHLNYWERLHELKLYPLQRRRERYIIIYIYKIKQHLVPNIDGTMGHKIKTRKHLRHGTQCLFSIQQTETQHIPFKKCNNCIWASFVRLVAKISERHLKYQNWIIKIWARQISRAHSWWAKNAQLCHRIRKQQHPRTAHSSEGSRNLPKWLSPWSCIGRFFVHCPFIEKSMDMQVFIIRIVYSEGCTSKSGKWSTILLLLTLDERNCFRTLICLKHFSKLRKDRYISYIMFISLK